MFNEHSIIDGETIPHYHGDIIRTLFIVAVILSLIVIPIWGYILPIHLEMEIGAGIILIILAGLTSPHARFIMALNVIVSAGSVFLLEWFALTLRTTNSLELLIVREVGAFLFLGALYFSVKTLRAMMQGKMGKVTDPSEFAENK